MMMTRFFAAVAAFFVLTAPGMARELCPVEDIYNNDQKCASAVAERAREIGQELSRLSVDQVAYGRSMAKEFIGDYNTWSKHVKASGKLAQSPSLLQRMNAADKAVQALNQKLGLR